MHSQRIEAERQVMNTHVDLGLEMIGKVLLNVIKHRHERLDGSGYPPGPSRRAEEVVGCQ